MGLWNCQFAVNKADLIPAIASQTALSILGLTETWIRPEDSATPAAPNIQVNLAIQNLCLQFNNTDLLLLLLLSTTRFQYLVRDLPWL